ncbi:hypothetical protein E4Z66_05740 [Aliishimia ponticola]|uniref:Uncharacterized protein n=1 Tax=Aliishimia ponticola TaxID=2499833 RepID=A0A4S4NHC7_9RHOB|nr:hypothetical protein [Aliishimia ponticola]THH39059.1 hypothetical protein E4Z66_05740 [Aliishimia ponticola]
MEIEGVRDKNSLRSYLGIEDEAVRIPTARRVAYLSAMRVAPIALRHFSSRSHLNNSELTVLPFFATLSYSAVVSSYPTPKIKLSSIRTAVKVSRDYANSITNASDMVRAASVATAGAAATAGRTAAATVAIAFASGLIPKFWAIVQSDLKALKRNPTGPMQRVWSDDMFGEIEEAWNEARATLEADPKTNWTFWITWYERALEGKNLYPEELALILDQFTEDDWLGDPAKVNPAFDPILELYRQDEAGGGGDVDPFPQRKPANIKAIRSQVVALKDYVDGEFEFLKGYNGELSADEEQREPILEVLAALREIIDDILRVFEEEEASTALVVVDEKVPAVTEQAEKLEQLETIPNISAHIIAMTATVKYMTDNGWSQKSAEAAALAQHSKGFVAKAKEFLQTKFKKSPPSLTRFSPKDSPK